MEIIDTDILVAGGGIAGLTATARLAAAGFDVTCVDPAPAGTPGADQRTTAFLEPAVATLERAGAWVAMAPGAAALWTMRLVDAGGRGWALLLRFARPLLAIEPTLRPAPQQLHPRFGQLHDRVLVTRLAQESTVEQLVDIAPQFAD